MTPNESDPTPSEPETEEPANPSDKKLRFLLSCRPGETWPEFKARVIRAAREAGLLESSPA
jgi:hypothetical protein